MAIYSLAPLLGPVFGPVCGAWIAQRSTWRWVVCAPLRFQSLGLTTILVLVDLYFGRNGSGRRSILPPRKCVVFPSPPISVSLTSLLKHSHLFFSNERPKLSENQWVLRRPPNLMFIRFSTSKATGGKSTFPLRFTFLIILDFYSRSAIFARNLVRPFAMFGREPIIQLLGLYMAFLYGIFYRESPQSSCLLPI